MNTKLLPNRFLAILATVPGVTDLDKIKNLLALWHGIHERREQDAKLEAIEQNATTEVKANVG